MNDLVAKRYVKALVDGRNNDLISSISNKLNTISSAFADEKFNSIISSPEVVVTSKVNFINYGEEYMKPRRTGAAHSYPFYKKQQEYLEQNKYKL